MKRVYLVAVLALCTVLALTIISMAGASKAPPYSVKPGLIFNNAKGTKAEQLKIITHVNSAIDHAPRGSTIRIAHYLFDMKITNDRLIAAYKRGVHVQMIVDNNRSMTQINRLRDILGSDKTKPSFVTICKHSCMASSPSVMHAKFFMFSASGLSRNVSMVSSANLYSGNTYTSWNNIHTIVGDTTIYNSLNKYFDDMLPDKDNPNYYRKTTSGKFKLYYFPRAEKAGEDTVVLLNVLRNVRCKGVASGYGLGGRTVIRVAQWGWSGARLDIARQLWKLHDQGCIVHVIYNGTKTSPKVKKALLKKSAKYGVMPVYDGRIDSDGDGAPDLYMHHKLVAINGVWFGRNNTKVVYTGSANFTAKGMRSNNEIVLRVKDDSTYNSYSANFRYIRDNWTKPVRAAPSTTAAQDAKLEATLESDIDAEI